MHRTGSPSTSHEAAFTGVSSLVAPAAASVVLALAPVVTVVVVLIGLVISGCGTPS